MTRAVRRHRIYGRTDSRIYGTRHRTVQEVSATADGTASARPAYRTDPYRQSRIRPYTAVSSPAITLIIPLVTHCLLAPLVLFISVPKPTQSQSFLDIELGLPPLCTARILLGSILCTTYFTLPLCRLLVLNSSLYSTCRTDRITHFIGLFCMSILGFDPLRKVPQLSLIVL
jgi:hypothetical protein